MKSSAFPEKGLAMPVVPFVADAAFDAGETRLLGEAFEAAWQVVQRSGSALADETHAASTRALLAKRVIEMGRRGERDHNRLVEAALHHVAESRSASDIAASAYAGLSVSLTQGR
jgi:hypothetical protein